ncbi:MAG: T9SS type A sorting domain-containing protein [Flavobacteriales bacterium]|nr:T9SS type A sorting domain-containing protein [Flavobacteriales bacterium]
MRQLSTPIALCCIGLATAQVPAYIPASGLVGWWPFNGNALDQSGNGHDLSVNGANLTEDRFGVLDAAYHFDGSAAHLNGGSHADFEIVGDRTISAWMKADANLNDDQGIVGYMGSSGALAGHAGYLLKRRFINPDVIGAYEDSALWGNNNYGAAWSDGPISQNQWHHLVLWRSGGTTHLYVDNVLQASSFSLTPYFLNSEFLVGWSGSPGQYFHGEIDDIGVWDRALSPAEIQSVFEAEGPGSCLIASFPFDGNALDTTGNGHDGVVYGATVGIGHDGGGCYEFDGIDDFIKLGGVWGGLNGTITAWINPDALSQYNPIFSRRDTTVNGSALELVVNINAQPDSSKLYKATDFRDCAGGSALYFRNSVNEIQAGVWTCVAMTADDAETKLFINGAEVGTYGDPDPGYWFENMCPGNISTYIGMLSRPLNTEHFKGLIDDVRIYDCALSASEIAAICDFTTTVAAAPERTEVLAYPNPTSGILAINGLAPGIDPGDIHVMDATGRYIAHMTMSDPRSGSCTIDLSGLPNGLYVLRVADWSRAIIKQD